MTGLAAVVCVDVSLTRKSPAWLPGSAGSLYSLAALSQSAQDMQ
jgi:hypothetical protein